ncbi:MAG: L-glutamate gamma-semialdehyde dehydrogenase, partial [Jannaschia sp.]
REAGKTLDDGVAEVREAVDFLRYYADEAETLCASRILPGPTGEANRWSVRGRGVFLTIAPWNFPLAIFLGQTAAALAVGNAVVAKPAPQTPAIAAAAIALLHEAGIPEDVLILAPGGPEVGAALVSDPHVAGVAFTGSTATAKAINRALAERDGPIVPLIAETGGINAMIADATALPEQVADDVVMSAFRSAGQRCSACRIRYVQEDVADRMIEMISGAADTLRLGDPMDPATDIGPIIDEDALGRLRDHIADRRVTFAGEAPEGCFMAPTIVELDRSETLDREVFGPVLHVKRYAASKLDTVLAEIEATGYGLTFGLHSRIDATIARVTAAIGAGNVYVNRNQIGAIVGSQPFGGRGQSGTGPKAGGPLYLPRFAEERVVSTDTTAAGGNASLIAMAEIGAEPGDGGTS